MICRLFDKAIPSFENVHFWIEADLSTKPKVTRAARNAWTKSARRRWIVTMCQDNSFCTAFQFSEVHSYRFELPAFYLKGWLGQAEAAILGDGAAVLVLSHRKAGKSRVPVSHLAVVFLRGLMHCAILQGTGGGLK